jgi:hypothetical protein
MPILQWLFGRRASDTLSRLAAKVAHESHRAVWNRVSHRVLGMRLNEARGYVRARAASCILAEADAVLRHHPDLNERQRADLVARATDHVVGLVIRDVLITPSRTAERRRAA